MIEVKFFGTARVKFQVRSIEVEANDVNIASLKMYKTKLNDGDKVMFLSPASGG